MGFASYAPKATVNQKLQASDVMKVETKADSTVVVIFYPLGIAYRKGIDQKSKKMASLWTWQP